MSRSLARAVAALVCAGVLVAAGCGERTPTAAPEQANLVPLPPPAGFERTINPTYGQLPAFRDDPEADALQAEQLAAGAPLLEGRFTNVRDGERATRRPAPCSCPTTTVWFFGGSAAFGIGQRDDGTIPSHLVRLAEADGRSVEVRNFGRPGETIAGEVAAFERRLAAEPPPDAVVFYDGFNDSLAGVVWAALHDEVDPDRPVALLGEDVLRYVDGYPPVTDVGGPEVVARTVVARYRAQRTKALELAARHGVAAHFVFQPDAFGSRTHMRSFLEALGYRDEELEAGLRWVDRADLPRVLDATSRELSPEVVNLRRSLDDVGEPIFAGVVHTNERGAELVAIELDRLLRGDR